MISRKPLLVRADGSYGEVTIFDAVGNVIRSNMRIDLANIESYKNYGIFWDGKNKNGRSVGRGTYLFVVNAIDIDNRQMIKNIKVGVKRSSKTNKCNRSRPFVKIFR